jgi:hypothetical protein
MTVLKKVIEPVFNLEGGLVPIKERDQRTLAFAGSFMKSAGSLRIFKNQGTEGCFNSVFLFSGEIFANFGRLNWEILGKFYSF